MFKTTFVVTPITGTNLVTVGITKKSFAALVAKTTFWSVAPLVIFVGGCALADWLNDSKSTNTEDHFPVTD